LFRKALLTLDRSAFSEAAIPALVAAQPESVVVLEVVESVASIISREMPAFDVSPDLARQIEEGEREAVADHLDAVAARLEDLGISYVKTMIGEGKPGPCIVDVAQEQECDLIVMSTHGRSGVRRAFLGSVANYVVNHVDEAAVLLVRPPKAESE
jgi:nucleotide-binding universal stress UspA family protein